MADRYWVGGSGNWDATSTANWSTSSGGAAGASAPTSADNVIFDAASNTGTNPFTVTVTGTSSAPAVCNDFSTGGAGGALDGAMTLALGATAVLDLYGSMTLPATNFAFSNTSGSALNFRATTTGKTFTTNGISVLTVAINFNGAGGEWTLGSALTCGNINVLAGSFVSGNFNITYNSLVTSGSLTRSISLGSSTLTASGSSPVSYTGSGLTWNAGTSQITCSNAGPTFAGGGLTFYNVSFTSAALGSTIITGANTFNDLSQTSRSATGRRIVQINDNQIVNGTLTLGAANTSIRRIQVQSNTIGTQRTITLNGTLATLADIDFQDINAAGTVATPWTGTRLGNRLGNSNITFNAPKTVYRVGTGNWSATQWSLSSGGSVDANNFPLAQDNAIFDTGTVTGTHTIDQPWSIGTLDCSALNVAVTLASGASSPAIFKNLILDSDITLTGTANFQFQGQGTTQTITSAGVSFPQAIQLESPSGTVQLLDNTTTTGAVTLTAGTLDLNDFDLNCFSFSSNNSNIRSIDFGTGEINITGNSTTIWTTATSTNFTYAGTPTVNATYSGSTGTRVINFNGISGATESNVLNLNVTAGSDIISIQNCFKNINLTGFSGTVLAQTTNRIIYGNLTIPNTVTFSATTFTTNFSATSGTQQITTNGVTLDLPISKDGAGTLQLQDNLTMGSTRTFTLTAGTLDLNDFDLSCGLFSSSNSNTRAIAFGTDGELTVLGVGTTAFNAGTSTNLTITGTNAKINMSGATAKTFAGGGFTYPLTLVQSGLGDLTLTGANTFTNMTNTVQPCTIIFPASTTTSFSNFNINGTAGNLVSLRSSTPGTRCVLAKV